MQSEKLDLGAMLAYREYLDHVDDDGHPSAISVVLTYEGDLDAVRAAGFEVGWSGDGEAVGTLNWADLDAITERPEVVRIAAGLPRSVRMDTAAREIHARASLVDTIGTDGLWHVEQPDGELTAGGGASGKDVIVGIIDTGIDVSHPSFCSAQLPYKTRILKIWDQGLMPVVANGEKFPKTAQVMSGKEYGVEFDAEAIEAAINGSSYPLAPLNFRHKDCIGHGTHVAAIAAGGNQVAGGSDASFVGVAPEADIVVVKMLDVPDTIVDNTGAEVGPDVRLRDAVIYILREAKARGRAVVINASFGKLEDPGDGLDNEDRFLDDVFDPAHGADAGHAPKGAVFIKSAGNNGDAARRQFAVITIPNDGAIVVPFELFDDRKENRTMRVNCKRVQFVPSASAFIWYREVPAPFVVSVAVRVPGGGAFSEPVTSGKPKSSAEFDGGKLRELFHESYPVTRPGDRRSPSSATG